MYKTAMLGCGGRARAHADAYRFVKGGKLAAICDMNEELLNKFGDDFDISSRYTDLDEMLEKEKPDVLHIVTAPVLRGSNERIRYPLMKQASDAGVPAAIVEKPIAVESEDWKQIAGLAEETQTKFVVNTQLNFHPQNLELKADVAADGSVKLSSLMPAHGVHLLIKGRMFFSWCPLTLTTRVQSAFSDKFLAAIT